ncbi:MAG: glycoside hydrolase family 16 protein [Dehalococcoidia bacterium]|nr:glycoside hydrolase family 16 protein [Dehalococcoidia bacterium]
MKNTRRQGVHFVLALSTLLIVVGLLAAGPLSVPATASGSQTYVFQQGGGYGGATDTTPYLLYLPLVDTSSPSGQPMPVGDIPGWHQVFTDDFLTDVPVGSFPVVGNPGPISAVSSKWTAYPDGWKDTSKNGTYYPSKVLSIQNGFMNLYIHTENGVHMVSAAEPKLPGAVGTDPGGLLYGRYVIRFKSDSLPGYKTTGILWPESEVWPRDGEIDFPEGNLDGTIEAFMHWQGGTSGGSQDAYSTNTTYTSWHTAVTEWTPTSVKFILDGETIGNSTTMAHIPNTLMHWVIQTETTTHGYPPSDTVSGNVRVDWVAVYVPSS